MSIFKDSLKNWSINNPPHKNTQPCQPFPPVRLDNHQPNHPHLISQCARPTRKMKGTQRTQREKTWRVPGWSSILERCYANISRGWCDKLWLLRHLRYVCLLPIDRRCSDHDKQMHSFFIRTNKFIPRQRLGANDSLSIWVSGFLYLFLYCFS